MADGDRHRRASRRTTGRLNYAGQTRWYKFAITPGSDLQIDLTNLPADYDLLLFKDIAQAYTALTNPTDLTQLTAESAGKSQQFSGKSQQFSGKSQQFSDDIVLREGPAVQREDPAVQR